MDCEGTERSGQKNKEVEDTALHVPQKGDVNRLYIKRAEGGRGLISIEDCVLIEKTACMYQVSQKKYTDFNDPSNKKIARINPK